MSFNLMIFLVLGSAAAVSAVLMLLQRNPVTSALFLILNFFCLGGIYLTLKAQFIAIAHILVYAGAIMVLFLFVVMLLNLGDENRVREKLSLKTVISIVCGSGLFLELIYLFIMRNPMDISMPSPRAEEIGTVETLGKILFTQFLLPFEATSLLLLCAMVGAVLIAKKKI